MTNKLLEIPDCYYPHEPILVRPSTTTPIHSLYLSNLDDQKFLRFSIKYIYIYKSSIAVEALKESLSRVLVEYYPLAGRLRGVRDDGGGLEKLEVDCNGQGAVMAEGFLGLTAEELLQGCGGGGGGASRPNRSWKKLCYRVEAQSFLAVPPLVIQVTHLLCGGMVLCTAINHCICDGIGSAQFLQAWALITSDPQADIYGTAVHGRHLLRPRTPPKIAFHHPEFERCCCDSTTFDLTQLLQSHSLVPVSVTFSSHQIVQLKKLCVPSSSSTKCTSFEVLASHVWRSWVKSLDLPPFLRIKLLFSVNVRKKLKPELPAGYYGNGFVLGCAETWVDRLTAPNNISHGVQLVQLAKLRLTNDYIRSMIDLLEERRAKPDLSASLVISQWSKLGLEDLDFGSGPPAHMGPTASEIYCLFLPVAGNQSATTVLVSVPQGIAERFENYLKSFFFSG